ncbi:hypothetical protein ACFOUO_13705 [Salinithrix halophila]|uniref:Uncharacterized protein n=1 Tax=Salinithrix halophila TaxID=1485204 RepID=A0ABV8JH60_9BACL
MARENPADKTILGAGGLTPGYLSGSNGLRESRMQREALPLRLWLVIKIPVRYRGGPVWSAESLCAFCNETKTTTPARTHPL